MFGVGRQAFEAFEQGKKKGSRNQPSNEFEAQNAVLREVHIALKGAKGIRIRE